MSNTRLTQFKECAANPSRQTNAHQFDLKTVKYDGKLTSTQIKGLAKYMKTKGITSFDKIMKYSSLVTASKILCRFPRPSELARVAVELGVLDKTAGRPYWRACVHLEGTNAAKLVGTNGANLIAFTKKHDLLYTWLKKSGPMNFCLCIYAKKEADVTSAAEAFAKSAAKHNMSATKTDVDDLKFSPRSRDFEGAEKKTKKKTGLQKELENNGAFVGMYTNAHAQPTKWANVANAENAWRIKAAK